VRALDLGVNVSQRDVHSIGSNLAGVETVDREEGSIIAHKGGAIDLNGKGVAIWVFAEWKSVE